MPLLASTIFTGLALAFAPPPPPPPPDLDATSDAAGNDQGDGEQRDAGDDDDVDDDDDDAALPRAERNQVRIAIGYAGTTYAQEVPWQSALALSGAWQSRVGVYLGAGYEFTAPFQTSLRSESAGIALTPRVTRYPVHAIVGYHWSRGRLGIDGELRVIAEPNRVVATTFGLGALDAGTEGIAQVDDISFSLGFSPRARLHFRPIERLSVQLSLGVDLYAINRNYFVEFRDPDTDQKLGDETYLRPRVARFFGGLGLVFWL